MRVTPQKTHISPTYPTKSIVDGHPELLCHVPERWRGNPTVMAALAGVGLLVSMCKASADNQDPRVEAVPVVFEQSKNIAVFYSVAPNPTSFAPVFLSEEEARDVIVREGKKAGITFTEGITLDDALMPPANSPKTSKADNKRDISFEFVSNEDCLKQEKLPPFDVQSNTPIDAANELKSRLSRIKKKSSYAVFYEPNSRSINSDCINGIDWESAAKRPVGRSMEDYKNQLREQVRDFIKWLKAEGII